MTQCATYPSGQCTWYCCMNWSMPVGPYWGDGRMWLTSAQQAGYVITTVAEVGAIAVWGANMGGARDAGHVAIVQAITPLTVAESNWNVPLQPDIRVVNAYSQSGIIGYILPTKTTEEPMTYTPDQQRAQIRQWYLDYLIRGVEDDAAMQYHLGVWNTKGMDVCLADIVDGAEAQSATAAKRRLLGLP